MNQLFHARMLATAILLCLATFCHAASPAPAPDRRPQPARWLLILDTSAAMKKRAKAVEGIAAELLGSSMNGQMRPGDELGVWSYNKELYAGVAPMQAWDPARSNAITKRTIDFLSRQVYRDTGRIENVLPELLAVARESRQLTVVWFSDGSQKFAGTPFNDELNAAQAKLRDSVEQTRMPVVTVLRGFRGKLTSQSVTLAPWPVAFPSFTNEVRKTNAPVKPVVETPKRVPNTNNMIIMGPGKKTNPAPVVTVTANDPGAKLRPLPAETVAEPANVVVQTSAPVPPPATNPVVAVVPTPAASVATPPPAVKETKPVELAANSVPPPVAPPTVAVKREPTPAPVAPQAIPATTATATSSLLGHKWPLLLGCGFMFAAAVVALLLARRSRRPAKISLITQSFDRRDK